MKMVFVCVLVIFVGLILGGCAIDISNISTSSTPITTSISIITPNTAPSPTEALSIIDPATTISPSIELEERLPMDTPVATIERGIIPTPEPVIDLAYMRVFPLAYSDDADPGYEGLSLTVAFYDSKSQNIDIIDKPIDFNIRLDGRGKSDYKSSFRISNFKSINPEILRVPWNSFMGGGHYQ